MAATVTALVVGAKARPDANRFAKLIEELWDEELVTRQAVVSVGPVRAERVVTGADKVGTGRTVRWKGTDLAGLLAAVRSAYAEDVAVWFESVDLDAFEPAEEEEYEDVEDDEDDGDEGDDEPAAAARPPAAKRDEDDGLGEFELVSPSMVLYSVLSPVEINELSTKATKKVKRFGPRAVWATLDGEDMGLLVDDLGDCWLLDVLEDGFGKADVGRQER